MIRAYEPEHLSHSALTGFIRCGKAFQLRRLTGAPEHPAWWSVGGSAVHAVTEKWDWERSMLDLNLTTAEQSVTIDVEAETIRTLDELVEDLRQESQIDPTEWFASGRHPDKQRYEFWKEQAPQMVQSWIDWRSEHGWKIAVFGGVPAIEFEVIVPIPGLSMPLKGYIDRVMELPSGDLVVVDMKTGARKKPLSQLGVYASAVEALGFPRPRYGVYWYARTGKHTPPTPLDKYTTEYISRYFQRMYAGATAGLFLPAAINDTDVCRTCAVQRACYAYGGDLSQLYDPDNPNYGRALTE